MNFLYSKIALWQLDQLIYKQYKDTNAGTIENEHLSFKADVSFLIKTLLLESKENDLLQSSFSKLRYISFAEILETLPHHTDTLSAFEHYQKSCIAITSHPALLT